MCEARQKRVRQAERQQVADDQVSFSCTCTFCTILYFKTLQAKRGKDVEELRRKQKEFVGAAKRNNEEKKTRVLRRNEERLEELRRENQAREEKMLRENEENVEKQRRESEESLALLLRENEAQMLKMMEKQDENSKSNPPKQLTAPECPVCRAKYYSSALVFLDFFQVCLDEMMPPTKIFHCVNGHHICETCKYTKIHNLPY